ncbi:MAG: hypothetical protein ACK42H_11495 [Planctomycetota bacterium]|jgi:hypothetical protein
MAQDDAAWLAKSPALREKLIAVGLVEPEPIPEKVIIPTLDAFLDGYIQRHGKSRKPATVAVWKQVVANLKEYMPKGIRIAEAIALPFHITGGSISSAYGEPRLTQDIDIVVAPDVAKIRTDDLIDQLACSDFLFTERVLRQAVQTGNLFQLLDKTESLKLDIYPRELITEDDFARAASVQKVMVEG